MTSNFKPLIEDEVVEAVQWAISKATPLEVVCAGTKKGFGRPFQFQNTIDVSSFNGIKSYEPDELIMSVKPGTEISLIESTLRQYNQMLAFEPINLSKIYGVNSETGTIGGAFACNLSGPRRLKLGAARDHLLGFKAVSGRGESFKSGGRVVKNVTGYDLSKLITGSFGTLAIMTELTFKVVPAPQKIYTILVLGLDEATATQAMAASMNSSQEVSGAAHIPRQLINRSNISLVSGADKSVTALRIEGFGPSVKQRSSDLKDELAYFGDREELHTHNSKSFWEEIRDATYLVEPSDRVIWRISVPPSKGHLITDHLTQSHDVETFLDWSGGLIWISLPNSRDGLHREVRRAIAKFGGHATLIRASADIRASVPVFHPQPKPLAALSARVKDSFDPKRILNPGRMIAGL